MLEVFEVKSGLSAVSFDTFFTVNNHQRPVMENYQILK